MNDSQNTRHVRLAADVDRVGALNGGTRVGRNSERVEVVDFRTLFNRHHNRMHQVLRELTEPGMVVFALHPGRGIVGRLWLAATDELRVGTVGRHSEVDLYLPHDEELSLRHLLVLVRMSRATRLGLRGEPPEQALHVKVMDLATRGGFQAEQGGVLRAVATNGTLILRVASYSLFLFPTGEAAPWNPDAGEPWQTLPPRMLIADERSPGCQKPTPARRASVPWHTSISFLEGPSEPGPEPLRAKDEQVEGHLVLSSGGSQEWLPVGARALDRGIILGRYARCTGDTVALSDDVSRVHAIVARVDGVLQIADAASTNGTRAGMREVKCESMVPGRTYGLGRLDVRWEPVQ